MLSRRDFNSSLAAGLAAASLGATKPPGRSSLVGPMVGHVSDTEAVLWCRPSTPERVEVVVQAPDGTARRATAVATTQNDLCVTWRLDRLQPSTRYVYRVLGEQGAVLAEGDDLHFDTAPGDDGPNRATLAFGSCADTEPLVLWRQIDESGVDGLVLLGDTPYIDSTNLAVAREKHRAFLSVPELAALVRHTPTWGTWDDHDFGRNDSDGRLKGKENTRRAFVEYRALREHGHRDEGVYTSFRRGPVEVFLLDTRWFARTAPSPVAPDKPTLLGERQWDWLRSGLANSTAPFKIVACGMIWDDKQNTESDDWGTYAHEREALFDFVGERGVEGVVLVGGDIHCSRWLRYDTTRQVGYPVDQFIVSPIHDRTIPKLNVKHPDLVRGEAIPHVWLRVEVDATGETPTLHAEWRQMNGREMWDVRLTADELSREKRAQ